MEIREKGNLIILYFEKNEDLFSMLNNVVREYMIIDAKITGFGFFKRMEFGILTQTEPLFFGKSLVEKLVTVSGVQGLIDNRDVSIMFHGVDAEKNNYNGKLFSAETIESFVMTLDILKTE